MVLLIALLAPFYSSIPGAERQLVRLGAAFARLASRRGWCIVLVAVLTLAAKAALAPLLGIRAPAVHDEFSYLLAGDTFASGRLTNPTHPMWVHFESFHIEHQPTYMSMYPPLQGGFLALGKVLSGYPIVGVWVSAAVFCAALCWMLQGWVPSGWALLGALLAVLRLALFSTWGNSYFGGAPAALGGALVLGALPRIKASFRPADAMLFIAGLLILANSRPYEGVLFTLPIVFSLLFWATGKNRPPFPALLRRAIVPAAALLLIGAAFMAYYNWRVFGSALTMPYEINRKAYAVVGIFFWQKPGTVPSYNHPVFRDFYVDYELQHFQLARTWHGFLELSLRKIAAIWAFFVNPALTLPLVAAATLLRRRELRFPVAVLGVFGVGLLLNTWFMPHYAAPATALLYLLFVYGIRHMRQLRIAGRPAGLLLAAGVPAVCLFMATVRVANGPMPWGSDEPVSWCCAGNGNQERAALSHQLAALPGKQLVLVKYGSPYNGTEWVYNEPDIDGAKVVWARYMLPSTKNDELLNYFQNRRVWLLDASLTPARLSPYNAAAE